MGRQWDYSFQVWPAEGGHFERVVFDLFRMFRSRVLVEGWTHVQFCEFREGLARNGFTLHEVERVPHVTPETVL